MDSIHEYQINKDYAKVVDLDDGEEEVGHFDLKGKKMKTSRSFLKLLRS